MMKENLPCGHSIGNNVTRWKCAAATADTTTDTDGDALLVCRLQLRRLSRGGRRSIL